MIFLQNITTLDFAFMCPETGLQGESLHVNVEIMGGLNEIGFVMDFGPAKKLLKQVLDELVDHKVVVPSGSAKLNEKGFTFATSQGENYEYFAPPSAYLVLPNPKIDLAALTVFLEQACKSVLPSNVLGIKIHLIPDPRFTSEACFRYTHGLRKHDGNCQRLLHGHRNPIEVRIAGIRSAKWEKYLAQELEGVHFAHKDTLLSKNLDFQRDKRNPNLEKKLAEISYTANQGSFRALIPAGRIILMDQEPSIENIARLGWTKIQELECLSDLEVTAYEGLNKGARYSGAAV